MTVLSSVCPHHRVTNMWWHTLEIPCSLSRVFGAKSYGDRVLAKTTKSKKQFYLLKEKAQKNTQLPFWWKAKSSSYEFAFKDFIFVVGSAVNSVGTMLEFAAFRSGPDAKYSRASALCFFCPQPWFLRLSEHHFPGKTPAFSCR